MIKSLRFLIVALALIFAAAAPGRAVPITFVYPDAAGEGFNDPTLGAARRAAFEAAANNYAGQFQGTIPLVVSATFDPLGGSSTSAVLGQAGPATFVRDWVPQPGFSAPPHASTWYAIGLANQLAGRDVATSMADITAQFNSDVDGSTVLGSTDFYYGTDGNAGSDIDFYSVVLHELGHGLGFVSFINPDGSFNGSLPSSYDYHLQQGSASVLTMNDTQRGAAIISNNLTFNGPEATAGNGGTAPKIYSPNPYQPGSSVSHLDESTFHGANELMTPVSSGVAHQLGPVATGVFKDIGWGTFSPADPEQSGNTLVVNTTADHNDSSCSEDDCTLREAINLSNTRAGTQTITFDLEPGDQTLVLLSSLPGCTDPIIILGPAEQKVTVDGGGQYYLFSNFTTSLNIQNLTLANSDGGAAGGAIYSFSSANTSVSLTNCILSGNSAQRGGGIYIASQGGTSTLTITNCTLSGNTASDYGAAVYADSNVEGATVTVNISGSTLSGNNSTMGAGLFLWRFAGTASATVTNSTFSGNTATSYGGAITGADSSVSVDSVTFAGNSASVGGAVASFNETASFTSRNSLYVSNSPSSVVAAGTLTSLGNNLFSANQVGFAASGDQTNLSNLASTLGPLANNGGPTRTHALLSGSPAINAGATALSLDQRGESRPQGLADDVGAFELVPVNTAPTISAIDDQTILAGASTSALPFTIGDGETPAASLTLSKASSNTTLVPLANIVFGGEGANRTVTVTPAAGQTGSATITVTVSDGALTASETFVVTVNNAPADSTPPSVTVTTPADGSVLK